MLKRVLSKGELSPRAAASTTQQWPSHCAYSTSHTSFSTSTANQSSTSPTSTPNLLSPKIMTTPVSSPTSPSASSSSSSPTTKKLNPRPLSPSSSINKVSTDHMREFTSAAAQTLKAAQQQQQQQQQKQASPTLSSSPPSYMPNLTTERQMWTIVSQIFNQHIDLDNTKELRTRVEQAVNSLPNVVNDAKKSEYMIQKILSRIEDKKELDPYRHPLLFI